MRPVSYTHLIELRCDGVEAVERARAAGWEPVNADLTVIAEEPRLAPFVPAMAEALGRAFGAPVSVKATRGEGLGAICLLYTSRCV